MSGPQRVAVVGSGIAGLSAAWHLADFADVTLFEADTRFGGHAHTVDVTLEVRTHGVDTGFLVFNPRTYPRLVQLFDTLGVQAAPAEMSFSVQSEGLEWSGASLDAVFAQRRNLLRPRFWRMLAEILRFNRVATAAVCAGTAADEPLGTFLERHRFSALFRQAYLLPMVGSIWSCPTEQMLQFPLATMLRFCHNHGLLQVRHRPQWMTVAGGSRQYVQAMLRRLPNARRATPVLAVLRQPPRDGRAGVRVVTPAGAEVFDEVVLACHTDQALALLPDAQPAERAVLGGIRYQPNTAVLHTDASVLPRRRQAWAAWNYERAPGLAGEQAAVCLHYLINRLQPLPWRTPVIVSLNPVREPQAACQLGRWTYAHPVFDAQALRAQALLPQIQGRAHLWFCGAWAGHGFHEDGLASALAVVDALRPRLAAGRWADAA